MPINQLTPAGRNELGAAFGYYPSMGKRRVQDPIGATEVPLQILRGRVAGTLGLPSDVLNTVRSPMPMEAFGDVDYSQMKLVPYGTSQLLKELPLKPTSRVGEIAGEIGSVAPITPMEALQAARLVRQAALAGGKVGKSLGKYAGEEFNATLLGERPNTMLGAITPTPRFIFVGENSKTWNKANAAKAVELEKAGASPEDIWSTTGTFRGPEGKLRQEISDQNLAIKDYRNTGGAIVINHPELQAGYEQIPRGIKVRPSSQIEGLAAYEAPKRELDWQMGEGGTIHVPSGEHLPRDIYAHELQHAVQAKEGFARGGSPSQMILVLEDLAKKKREEARTFFDLSTNNDPLNPQIIKPGARQKGLALEKQARLLEDKAMMAYHSEQAKMDLYNQLAGEAEARAVQARINMTPAERQAKFPYESYDVPLNQLIIRK